jgi:hypothetical protein
MAYQTLSIWGCARDARVEAKAARRDDRRAREASPDVVRLPGGGDPMGGGDGDSFQAAQARWLVMLSIVHFTVS